MLHRDPCTCNKLSLDIVVHWRGIPIIISVGRDAFTICNSPFIAVRCTRLLTAVLISFFLVRIQMTYYI
jgi:hypothetical protein